MGRSDARVLLLALALVPAAVHCSSPAGPPDSPTLASDAGAPPDSASGKVTPAEGGVVTTPDGTVTVEVPAGAVSKETVLTIVPSTTFPDDPQVVPGTVFDFGPSGITFAVPVKMTIAYDPARLRPGIAKEDLRIQKAVGASWNAIEGSTVATELRLARAEVFGFSTYGVRSMRAPVEQDAEPPVSQGELVADGLSFTDRVRVFGSHVYWTGSSSDATGVGIRRAPLAGGPAEMVASDLNTSPIQGSGGIGVIHGLVQVGSTLFFANDGALYSVPASGGVPSPHATSHDSTTHPGVFGPAVGLATDGTYLYWPGGGFREPFQFFTVTRTVAASTSCAGRLITDEICSHTHCRDLAAIRSPTKAGAGPLGNLCTQQGNDVSAICCGPVEIFAEMRDTPTGDEDFVHARDVVIADGYMYWAEMTATQAWIVRKAVSGGSVEVVATEMRPSGFHLNAYYRPTVGGGYVYWGQGTDPSGKHRLVRAPVTGGPPQLIDSVTDPLSFLADASSVYYIVQNVGIYRRAHAGGSAALLATIRQTYADMAMSSTHVYYADSDAGTTTIRRVAK